MILLAELASSLGTVDRVIHAAGVSPSQAPPQTILNVDLYGTAQRAFNNHPMLRGKIEARLT